MLQQWNEIEAKIKSEECQHFFIRTRPYWSYRKRFLTDDIDRVQVDKKDDCDRLLSIIQKVDPKSNTRKKVSFFDEEIPIFERFNVERQIEQTFMRRVLLPSGEKL